MSDYFTYFMDTVEVVNVAVEAYKAAQFVQGKREEHNANLDQMIAASPSDQLVSGPELEQLIRQQEVSAPSVDATVESENISQADAEVVSKPEGPSNPPQAEATIDITDDDQLWADFDKTAEREAEANTQAEILREQTQKETEGLGN